MRIARFIFAASVAFTAVGLQAQEVTAGIYGTVQDATGAVVPNAAISLHNVNTGRNYQTLSDSSGNFALTLIPIGQYEGIGLPYWAPRESRASVNCSAESRWLAAELEKIHKEPPSLWTNAEISFRI